MSQYSEGQTHQLMEALERHGYSPAEVTALGQNTNGILSDGKIVLTGIAAIVKADFKLALDKDFSPAEFIGNDWGVWKGPADGNGLEGSEDSVQEPGVVDFWQVIMETHLQDKETSVHGEEKMRRARAGKNRQLGGRAFLAFWNNWLACKAAGKPKDSVLEKLRKAKKIGNVVYFLGLVLRRSNGSRYVLCLCFDGSEWSWGCRWLGSRWGAGGPSVALASVEAQP